MYTESFSDRLKDLIGSESARSFAQRVEVGEGTIRALLKGGKPTLDTLVAIRRASGVELEWLATGAGPKRPANAVGAPAGFVPVPRLEIRPSAGPGSLSVYEESEPDVFAFREEWLRRIGVSPNYARLMIAKGDSMSETINDGDLMIVDVSIHEIVNGAIHVLVYGGMVILKRLQLLRSGVLLLKSDNPRYDTEEVPLHEQPELIIEGRVRWAGGTI